MNKVPAKTVIDIMGGVHVVSDITGKSVTRVRRWTYPKEKGGTGGFIPLEMGQRLLEHSHANGLNLNPAHFFNMPSDASGESK